jgi:hypothetical protein
LKPFYFEGPVQVGANAQLAPCCRFQLPLNASRKIGSAQELQSFGAVTASIAGMDQTSLNGDPRTMALKHPRLP